MPIVSPLRHKAHTVDEYFARLPSKDCVETCEDFIDRYYDEAAQSGRIALFRTSFYDYYEGYLVRGQLYRRGSQGEQTGITVNNYHNLIKHRITQACQQRLSYEPQAIDGTHRAMEQVRLAKGILDLYTERPDIDLDGIHRKAALYSQLFGESFVSCLWDESIGKSVALDTETQSVIPEGDVALKVHDPLEVVRDIYRTSSGDDEWIILREEVNKVNLAVQYPQFETEIMAQSLESTYNKRQIYPCYSEISDIIWVWTLFHDRTVAVPQGRLVKFITPEIILSDGPLPSEYETIPVHRMAEEDLCGTPWGNTDAFDAMPICHAISRLHA
ncbi:MAG: hypothetical protein KGJ13_08480, partial [Patescibacteria group bacterium]|nr:hypothetical protein [Patescibacteria group bacterium]